MPRRRARHEEEHENVDRWLVSYADFITLLFAFFVTMYSISKVDQQRFASVVQSLQRALGTFQSERVSVLPSGQISPPVSVPQPQSASPEKRQLEKLAADIQREVEKVAGSGNQIQYFTTETGLVIRVPERLFFDSGDASIHPEVFPILNAMIRILETATNSIRVEGHTDNVPINNSRFPSNWELSTARATAIIRHLLTQGNFEANRISASGYAEFQPVAVNTTAEGRLQNRRVDVVILASKKAGDK